MPKKRSKTRANRKKKQALDRKNAFGVNDLTPVNAVRLMNGKKEILLR